MLDRDHEGAAYSIALGPEDSADDAIRALLGAVEWSAKARRAAKAAESIVGE